MNLRRGVPAFDKKYWERLVKRQITEREFGAAFAAVQNDQNKDRRAKKRAGIKAIRTMRRRHDDT
jgi:hypothetical protein